MDSIDIHIYNIMPVCDANANSAQNFHFTTSHHRDNIRYLGASCVGLLARMPALSHSGIIHNFAHRQRPVLDSNGMKSNESIYAFPGISVARCTHPKIASAVVRLAVAHTN